MRLDIDEFNTSEITMTESTDLQVERIYFYFSSGPTMKFLIHQYQQMNICAYRLSTVNAEYFWNNWKRDSHVLTTNTPRLFTKKIDKKSFILTIPNYLRQQILLLHEHVWAVTSSHLWKFVANIYLVSSFSAELVNENAKMNFVNHDNDARLTK